MYCILYIILCVYNNVHSSVMGQGQETTQLYQIQSETLEEVSGSQKLHLSPLDLNKNLEPRPLEERKEVL